jgi:hypothetical protein
MSPWGQILLRFQKPLTRLISSEGWRSLSEYKFSTSFFVLVLAISVSCVTVLGRLSSNSRSYEIHFGQVPRNDPGTVLGHDLGADLGQVPRNDSGTVLGQSRNLFLLFFFFERYIFLNSIAVHLDQAHRRRGY